MFNFVITDVENYTILEKYKNIRVYRGISAEELTDLIKNSKFLLARRPANYDRFSGSYNLAFSFEKPLIVDKKTRDIYEFPGIVFENDYSEIIEQLNMSNEDYDVLVSEIKEFNRKKLIINKEKLSSLIKLKTALIVEPRNLERLPLIINHFQNTLGSSWNFVFYCGVGLKQQWSQQLNNVDIRELPVGNLNAETYSDLFKNIEFWKSLPGEWILTFQTDAWIVNNPPFTIDYFIQRNKSYLGGNMDFLWVEMRNQVKEPILGHYNGGLSLRKKSHMIHILNKFPPMITVESKTSQRFEQHSEDVYFTIGCYKLGFPIANDEEDSHFAIHKIFHSSFFGIHNPRKDIIPTLEMLHPDMKTAYI
jgi:hypothetical protein